MDDSDIKLTIDSFGEITNVDSTKTQIKRYTWECKQLKVQVINYGATITKIKVPDSYGEKADIVMGFDDINGYQMKANPYFGATVGRYANRIKNGYFLLNGKKYDLSKNMGNNHLHGGVKGFDKVVWNSYISGKKVIFSYLSKNGEEGYPGDLLAEVIYEVSKNSINITMKCKTTMPTPVNLTNHSYFNLAGHDAGPVQMYSHIFTINSNKFTPLDEELTTTGEIKPVKEFGIEHDLNEPTPLHKFMPSDGFDINFCIKDADSTLKMISKVHHPISGRIMEVYSNQPGVQFYTSNFLPKDNEEKLIGKKNASYVRHGAFCLEPQAYPNSVNQDRFPSSILNPGEEYVHQIVFKFDVKKRA